MKTSLRILFLSLFCIFAISCSGEKGEQEPEFRFLYSIFFPATHVHSILAQAWADEINQRTDGRVRIDIYCGSLLSGAGENYECVVNGVSDLGMSCFSYSRGMFPLVSGLDLPFGYKDGKQATRIANDFIKKFQPKELDEVEVMYVHAHGPGVLATRAPVASLKDIHGMSIRGTGVTAQMVRALKANPIGLGQGDTYEALRKGVVDGTLCPIETLKGWRQAEVINHVTKIPAAAYTTTMFVVMNKNSWNKLPPDIQDIFRQVNAEWIDKHGAAWDMADAAGEELVQKLNRTITEFSPEENSQVAKMLSPMLEKWAEDLEEDGLPGRLARDFLAEEVKK